MLKATYKLSIADWSINSADDPNTGVIALDIIHSLQGTADICRVSVYVPPAPKAGLMQQAIGAATGALGPGEKEEAFSVQVYGKPIKHGDVMTIDLTVGGRSAKVVTADLQLIESSFGKTKLIGRTGAQKLVNSRLNQIYQNQSLNQIVKDLASQAGVSTGDVDTGSTYPYLVIHESKNLFRHIRELAARDNLDMFFTHENKLNLKKFNKSKADHTFYHAVDILDLKILNYQPITEHVLVYGESPSSKQGSDSWPRLAKDLSPFRSEVGSGVATKSYADGAIRTKDAADNLSVSKIGTMKDHANLGRLTVLGHPGIQIGDAMEIKNAPKPELNGLLKVNTVRHVLNKRDGYLTLVDFTGQGGAETAGGLLGALGGLTGAVGL